MWLYLRFSKLIRNRSEHENALHSEKYRLRDSKGLAGAIYTADATEFRQFARGYWQYQIDRYRDLLQGWKEGENKCEK
jgi:hypothetical protein